MYTYNKLKNGDKTLPQVEEDQRKFRSELNEITIIRGPKKSQIQSDTIKNVKKLYNSRQKIIDLLNDNSRVRSAAIYKAKQNEANKKSAKTGLKILTLKQMLQILSIALA